MYLTFKNGGINVSKLIKWPLGLLILIMLVMLAACGGSQEPADGGADAEPEQDEATDEETDDGENEEEPSASTTDFPNGKPITLIVPHAAGGGTDLAARALANAAEKQLDTTINVVNKTGGGGAVGMGDGITAKPDGYTVTMITVELVTLPHMGLAPFTYEDYAAVAQVNYDPGAFAVKTDAKWETFEELLEDAKANPGQIDMTNSGAGSIWHLNSASVENDTGVEFNHVPFDGAAPSLTALIGGHVDVVSASPGEIKQHVESGEVRVLAVSSAERSDFLPDVPTIEELGIETPSIGPWRGIAAPKDTPEDVIAVLEEAFLKAAEDPDFQEFMNTSGFGIDIKDAEGFSNVLAETNESYKEIIEVLGL